MRKAFAWVLLLWAGGLVASLLAQGPGRARPVVNTGRRVALVVGNTTYPAAPLRNARNDAVAIAQALREGSFEVSLLLDATRTELATGIERLRGTLGAGDIAFFYFGGHSLQVGGNNYLVPIDFVGRDENAARLGTVPLALLQEAVRRARSSVIVLDASRDNPFLPARSAPRGLAAASAPGSLIVLAGGAGAIASDNANGTSPFTRELLASLRTSGMTASELFRRLREQVSDASGRRQTPALFDNLVADFVVRPANASASAAPAPVSPPPRPTAPAVPPPIAEIVPPPRAAEVPPPRPTAPPVPPPRPTAPSAPALAGPATVPATRVSVPRFAAVEAPDVVAAGQEFGLVISLSESNSTPQVRIEAGQRTADGRLDLKLPAQQRSSGWDLDVAVSAPTFAFRNGANTGTVHLEERGDSTPLLFHLTPQPDGARQRTIYVTFWYKGGYVAKVARDVSIGARDTGAAGPAAVSALLSTVPPAPAGLVTFELDDQVPDLTVWENPDTGEVLIDSPYLQPARGSFDVPLPEMASWIRTQLDGMSTSLSRGLSPTGVASAQAVRNRLEGFGIELYRRFAPRVFKDSYWRLRDQLGPGFDSILILSSNPVVPWELMSPTDGTRGGLFLGIDFRLGRWHVTKNSEMLDRPPQSLAINGIVVLAPAYAGSRALASQTQEVDFLRKLPGFKAGPGRMADLLNLIADPPGAMVHFSGHGRGVGDAAGAGGALLFEDGEIDPLVWKGARKIPGVKRHPFLFFNACDVGQAQQRANFVEGWAPTVLETGAAGFVGGLWPLPDASAAAFAVEFYRRLNVGSNPGMMVAEALRATRARFYVTGDPTYLAYAYYGDPNLRLTVSAN